MLRVIADNPHHTFSVDDLALIADLFYRGSYLHNLTSPLLVAICDSAPFQIVGRELHKYLVAGQDADKILSHLARDVSKHFMFVALDRYLEHRVRKGFEH